MVGKILVANRGEIAVRIMRTCREMGIPTVGVFSEADRRALHVQCADEAVFLGGTDPGESYLNSDKIIAVARQTRADAIHPGYGFFSENPEFAERCEAEGLVFIGPPASTIRLLGDKTRARATMEAGAVPVIPGMIQPEDDLGKLHRQAEEIGYPVLLKAAAGGGGKGMRVVFAPQQLNGAFEEAASEARRAFGNGAVYLEKYLERARHVEIQVLADRHGQAVHLGERECSIQRRHQKIIEETPSPALSPQLRESMGQAALSAVRAAGYTNAGTVEFLLDEKNRFYFLEVNTRLQVEHPITEAVTGIDLVRQQINIASGQPLSFRQSDIRFQGHAIECRIYAEDPESDFIPSAGRILYLKEPMGPGIRVDSGIYRGFDVSTAYDPILSKLIVHAADRPQAIERMRRALADYVVLGIKTPVSFLRAVIGSAAFCRGETHTRLIDELFSPWRPVSKVAHLACIAYAAAQEAPRERQWDNQPPPGERFLSPWETLGSWSL